MTGSGETGADMAQAGAGRVQTGAGLVQTGADMVISALLLEGVDTVFGIPGGSNLALYDALAGSPIRHILVRHEQAAAHAADGYARASGRVGVCFATSGPGATNLVTGLANACMDSSPIVAITGQVKQSLVGTDAFQEADIAGITIGVTKHNYLVRELNDIPRIVREAFYIAGTGRYGPVLVDIPRDLLAARGCPVYSGSIDLPGYTPGVDVDMQAVRAAADAIRSSRKPLIIAGGGVVASRTEHLLKELAGLCGVPVALTLMGLGVVPYDHPLALGMIGMHGLHSANRAATACDLVVGVGTRFDDRAVGVIGGFASKATVVHIDIDPAEIDKNVRADIALVGDARSILPALLEELKDRAPEPGKTAAWQRQVKKWRAAGQTSFQAEPGELKPQSVMEAIWDEAGDQAIVATEVGQHQMWAALHSRLRAPRRFITSGGLGTMGFGFPAAIGAKVAKPDTPVVLVAGDGSFQMNMQELATAAQYDIPIVVCIINNGGLGMVRQWQTLFYGRRHFAVDFSSNPDFVKIAEAYGLPGLRVTTEDGVRPALRKALASGKTFVIDFMVAQQENVFPMTIDGGPVIPIRRKKKPGA